MREIQVLIDYGMSPEHAAQACACKSFTEAAKVIRFNVPGHVLSLSEVKRLMGYVFCDSTEAGWDDIGASLARLQSSPIVPAVGIDPSLQAMSAAQLLCEAWEYLEDMPEPTDMVQQAKRESLLVRMRAWGKA